MRLVLCAVLLLAASVLGAAAASRALVIGNDSYSEVPALLKARSDSLGYSAHFEARGFDVTRIEDADGRTMRQQLALFYDRIQPGDTVVFAFSGHGWSDGTSNFLLPTDIPNVSSPTLIAAESFTLRNGVNGIIDEIHQRGPALTVAIIDACRNNPFAGSDGTRSVGLARGLVRVTAPTGTFIAFSAGEGQTALDRLSDGDAERYSVFTRHFLAELSRAQDLQSAFKATQLAVNRDAQTIGHPQRPAYYDEVIGTACLSPGCAAVEVAGLADPGKVAPEADAQRSDPVALARAEWQDFKDSDSERALRLFAERHSGTPYAALALDKLDGLADRPAQSTARPLDFVKPDWCPKAATAAELAICNEAKLSALDLRMSELYKIAFASRSGAGPSLLRTSQRNWLSARNACRSDLICLERAYEDRITYLLR